MKASRSIALLVVFLVLGTTFLACTPAQIAPVATTAAPASTQATAKAPVSTTSQAPAKPPAESTKAPAGAQSQEKPYFQDKTITILVTSAAGGGTDTIARITAAVLPKYIPGNPKVLVQNKPGGGGMVAANSFFLMTKPDGLTLLQSSSSQISGQMRSVEGIQYDLTKMGYIGNVSLAGSVMIVNKKTLPSISDPRARPLAVGARSGEESGNGLALWGQEVLGWNLKWIIGFGGGGEIDLAFRRGELDIQITYNSFILKPFIQEGLAQPVTQQGIYRNGKFNRRPDYADVPTLAELMGDKKPTGAAWQSYLAWIGPSMIDKFLIVPPGTPDNITNILVDAYSKMSKDAKFDEMVKKMVGEPYDVGIGKDTGNVVKELVNTPQDALQYGIELQKKYGLIGR